MTPRAQYFRDVAALAGAGGPPDPAQLAEVMGRYGLTPAAQRKPAVREGLAAS